MRFAYADPPYLGLAKKFYGHLHKNAAAYDRLETHADLILRLDREYPDGWAMSLSSTSLADILSVCPPGVRVLAWIKPFCSFKPGVGLAYAWEPIILGGGQGRKRGRDQHTVRDWAAINISLKKGFQGAKPRHFIWWLLDVLNAKPGDTVDDLFPGSGECGRAIISWPGWKAGASQENLLLE